MAFFPELKQRTFTTGESLNWRSRTSVNNPWQEKSQDPKTWESILSFCHKGRWPVPYDTDADVGGSMILQRRSTRYVQRASEYSNFYRGQTALVQMTNYTVGQAPALIVGDSVMNAFGTRAVAAVIPTNPNASLAVTIGELRKDGLPRLPGSSLRDQTDAARRAGNEYLNVEFGWLPLVNDLQAFAASVRRSRELIEQYRRDSDRKIRRRFVAPPLRETAITTGRTGLTNNAKFATNVQVDRVDEQQYWFSGAFKYHVPVGDDFMSRLARYEQYSNYLFGTRITPELVWNLAPWSWAIDWFTNAGDVIHNISQLGSDGLVMQYGYAMRHSRVSETARGDYVGLDGSVLSAKTVATEWSTEVKQRIPANPYGFGIDDVSLSERQLAILAALGLTRGKRDRY